MSNVIIGTGAVWYYFPAVTVFSYIHSGGRWGPHCSLNSTSPHRYGILLTYLHAGGSDGESESDSKSSYSWGPHFITLGDPGTATGNQSVTQLIAPGRRGDTVIKVWGGCV